MGEVIKYQGFPADQPVVLVKDGKPRILGSIQDLSVIGFDPKKDKAYILGAPLAIRTQVSAATKG